MPDPSLQVELSTFRSPFLPQHQALLDRSAIAPAVAAARGYRSLERVIEFQGLKPAFADFQRRVPGLLIPVYDVQGDLVTYQVRPDDPRRDAKGKPIKYETPAKGALAIDVPRVRLLPDGTEQFAAEWLRDPRLPLLVTEGARKADAAVSQGLCCIGLLGVSSWRLPDWDFIVLKGRRVLLCFDSDVMRKRPVYEALRSLREHLGKRKADVAIVYLPEEA